MQFRMPPLLAAFISSHFYEGKLLTHPSRAAVSLVPHRPSLVQLHHEQAVSPAAEDVGLSEPVDDQAESAYTGCTPSGSSSGHTEDNTRGPVSLHPWGRFAEKEETANNEQRTAETSTNKHSFPWPDGSEGDRDLAGRLLQQLQADCGNPSGHANHWAHAVHCGIPKVLPVLFVDTSHWASGPSRRLAKLMLPPTTADIAATSANSAATIDGFPGGTEEKRSPLLRCLSAEQRVKGSLQNPLCVWSGILAFQRPGTRIAGVAILLHRSFLSLAY